MAAKKKETTDAAVETTEQVTAKDETENKINQQKIKNEIIKSLKKSKREGMEDLINFMEEIGFFTAPCSGGNHLCKEGGLAEHSMNVMFTAEKLSVSLFGGQNITEKLRSSIVIASVLHDLGKCGDYDKQLYVPNILKSGKQSVPKPFKRNTELSNVPHAIRSIKIATLFIDLTEDEEWAILTHDGLYDFMKYEMTGHETPLSMLIHWADMWSSKVIERDDTEDVGEE